MISNDVYVLCVSNNVFKKDNIINLLLNNKTERMIVLENKQN